MQRGWNKNIKKILLLFRCLTFEMIMWLVCSLDLNLINSLNPPDIEFKPSIYSGKNGVNRLFFLSSLCRNDP